MLKVFISFLLVFITVHAKDLAPTHVYQASGAVTDIVAQDSKIYIATDASCVDIFDLSTNEKINQIKVPQIKDFMGDVIDAKIYNVDAFKNNILLTAQAAKGFREVHLYSNGKMQTIIDINHKMFISKAKFVDENTIVFSLLSNEMYLYDIANKKIIWRIDVHPDGEIFNSKFSDFTLNDAHTKAVVADESGDLKIVDIKRGKVINVLANKNLDNVFKVDWKQDKIITAGQDGRCVVYDLKTSNAFFIKTHFLIYGAGLSPSGKWGAYSSDEENNVTVFKINTKSKKYKLTQNLMTLSAILFTNENEIFVTTDSNKFNYYKLQ
ncbi:MAG: WD40 repeat domain-containing protein [Campylobacterota bacterium]|nr:WD40 repeat domain-containing protein [Campylobacterota bacterium]